MEGRLIVMSSGHDFHTKQTPPRSKTFKEFEFFNLTMITKKVNANGVEFTVRLTDQVINQVNNLKNLYNQAYEDAESFEQVSSEISSTINDIATAVQPSPSDGDLDDLIQEIIKAVDNKTAQIQKELEGKSAAKSKK